MIKPQKKSKSVGFTAILLTIIMIIGCFTTACQPTPEELVVQNKADDDLEEAIAQTANPSTTDVQEIENSVQELTNENQQIPIAESKTNSAGTVTVNIDGLVEILSLNKIPVAYVEPIEFSESQIYKIMNAFFGNSELYEIAITKEDIEQKIINMKRVLEDDEALLNSDMADATGITDLYELRKMQEEKIEKQTEKLQEAAEEREVLNFSIGTDKYIHGAIETDKDYLGYFSYSNELTSRYIDCLSIGGEWDSDVRNLQYLLSEQVDINNSDENFSNAKKIAINLINQMGIEGVRLGEAYKSMDIMELMNFLSNHYAYEAVDLDTNRQFYVFCFERVIGEGAIDFTFYNGSGSDDEYDATRPYEKILVWVEDNNVVQFNWTSPFQVTEIVNENVELQIDYTQAISLMYQQAFSNYGDLWEGRLKDMIVNVDKIELSLVRIKEKNSSKYLVVPAWKFYGDLIGKLTDEALEKGYYGTSNDYIPVYGRYITEQSRNIITINALDGTLIDMAKGY